MVDRLEEGGLVVRTVGEVPRDRRAVTIRLTEQGERLAATVADAVLEQLSLMRTVQAELTTVIDLVDAGAGLVGRRGCLQPSPRPGATSPADALIATSARSFTLASGT